MSDANPGTTHAAPSDNACCKPGGSCGGAGKFFAGGLIVGLIGGLFGGVFLGPVLENWGNQPATPGPAATGGRRPGPTTSGPTDQTGGPNEGDQRGGAPGPAANPATAPTTPATPTTPTTTPRNP